MDIKTLTHGIEALKASQSGWQSRVLWIYTAFSIVAVASMSSASGAESVCSSACGAACGTWGIFPVWGGVTAAYILGQKAQDIAAELTKGKALNRDD